MGLFKKSKAEPHEGDPNAPEQQSPSSIAGSEQPAGMNEVPLTEEEHHKIIAAANHALDVKEEKEGAPALPPRPQIFVDTKISELQISSTPTPTSVEPMSAVSSVSDDYVSLSGISPLPSGEESPNSGAPTSPSAMDKIKSNMTKGYNATTHFAGGLLRHPSESNKHFSILRHENGLVFYQGTETSLPISIFSDASLPPDHSLWLQSKGWTGNTGMAAKALVGRNGYWLNVTPSIQSTASQLNPVDEKAYQRDIAYFLKKADKNVRKTHVLRQTCLVRIPVEAGDGYFRVVLCMGPKKKVLCPSPVFRVLSTSISPSSMKGSNLSTLPLEIGAMVLTTAAKVTAMKAVAPVKLVAMAPVEQFMPSKLAKRAGKAVYSVSRAGKRVDATVEDANERYDQLHATLFLELGGAETTPDSGPVAPYPLDFTANASAQKANRGNDSIPGLHLEILQEDTAHRLNGYYFGWARVTQIKSKKSKKGDTDVAPNSWYQAVISAIPKKPSELARLRVMNTNPKDFTLTIVEETEGISFGGSSVKIKVMGFIRPSTAANTSDSASLDSPTDPETHEGATEAASAVTDMAIAQASLDRPAWGPELVLEKIPTGKSVKSEQGMKGGVETVKSRYAHTRMTVSRQVDRVPFYRAGLRVGADRMRDKGVGTGGIYVVRD